MMFGGYPDVRRNWHHRIRFHETQARLRVELSCEDCQSLDAHPVTKEPNQ